MTQKTKINVSTSSNFRAMTFANNVSVLEGWIGEIVIH
jgi:hypothetical protein